MYISPGLTMQEENTVYQTHDKMAKMLFSDRENAMDYLKTTLPENIQKKLEWDSLQLENKSYINENLKETFSDIVYSCNYDVAGLPPVKISFLFEHKSQYVPYVHLQMILYMGNIWQEYLAQNKKPPVVIPMIFYHGKEKWIKRKFAEFFYGDPQAIAELLPFIPDFDYLLTDLSSHSNEEIKDQLFNQAIVKTVLLLMKNFQDADSMKQNLADFLSISEQYFQTERGIDYMKAVILYLFNQRKPDRENIIKEIQKSIAGGNKMGDTIADYYIEQGIQKGIQKGKQEGRQEGRQEGILNARMETARNMKSRGLDDIFISEMTGLPIKEIEKL